MANKTNIVIDQGTDYIVTINVKDGNTTPIGLEGYTGQAQLRKYYTSSKKYNFTVAVSANTGEVTLSMAANTTSSIPAGRYLYDCSLTSNTNVVSRIVEGIVTINPRVTR